MSAKKSSTSTTWPACVDPHFMPRMRVAGRLAASTLEMIAPHVRPGVSTAHLNTLCETFMRDHGAVPAPLGKGFPKAVCTSRNHVICHGIPDDKPLYEGDILNIDVSLEKDGVFADTCTMFFVGDKIPLKARRVVQCAQECLYKAIACVKPGASLRTIGRAIEQHALSYGYATVREFCGHGIGYELHGEPQILHYEDVVETDHLLVEGMTFTIEPMINVGKSKARLLADGWTAVTADGSLSAQFEHTLCVTEQGVEIVTLRSEESLDAILNRANAV